MKFPLVITEYNIIEVKRIFKKLPYNNIEVMSDITNINSRELYSTITEIMKYHSTHLLKLSLKNISMEFSVEMLKMSENVKELELDISCCSQLLLAEINMPNLKILHIKKDFGLCQSIKAKNLEILKKEGILEGLHEFLKISSNLKVLDVENSIRHLYGTKLNLQKLNCGTKGQNVASSIEFLESQKSTLEDLAITIHLNSDAELIKCILYSLRVRKLKITIIGNLFNSACFGCNNTIQELQLCYFENNEDIMKIISCLSAVEKLKLRTMKNCSPIELEIIADSLPKLRHFHLENCLVKISERTKFENVEILKISSSFETRSDINWTHLALVCPNMKELVLSPCSITPSMLDLQNVLSSCKKLENIEINSEKFKIVKSYNVLHLEGSSYLKSIVSAGRSIKKVFKNFKKMLCKKIKINV